MMQSSYIHRTVTQYGRSSAKGERSGTSLLLVIVVFEYLLIYTLVSLLCKVYIANKEVQFFIQLQLCHTYNGHEASVYILLPFGMHLISADESGVVKVWDTAEESMPACLCVLVTPWTLSVTY